jgi:hypothetical protein
MGDCLGSCLRIIRHFLRNESTGKEGGTGGGRTEGGGAGINRMNVPKAGNDGYEPNYSRKPEPG